MLVSLKFIAPGNNTVPRYIVISINKAISHLVQYYTVNPLSATLKPHSNGPSYNNTVTVTLAIDGWAVTFGTVRR